MPVSFLSQAQCNNYAKYPTDLPSDVVDSLFFLDDQDNEWIAKKRGDFSRLGYALQLITVRFIGAFISNLNQIPRVVIERIATQIKVNDAESCLSMYIKSEQRWRHTVEIRSRYGYVEFSEKGSRFRLGRILCALCWTGTDRPGLLFDHAVDWLSTNKILLPGITVLERFVAEIRSRMESRLWRMLIKNLSLSQQEKLNDLLVVEDNEHLSLLDKLRKGPVSVSSTALVQALKRVESARNISVKLPLYHIPACKIAALARFANTAKITSINRLSFERKMATLVAFANHLESDSQDDAMDVLSMVLRDLFSRAKQENKKMRLRTLKDLDQATAILVDACKLLLNTEFSDHEIRDTIYTAVGHETLVYAVKNATALIRPPSNVFYHELEQKEKTVQNFLPSLLRVINFDSNQAGKALLASLEWLKGKQTDEPPMEIIGTSWRRNILIKDECSVINWPQDEPRPTYRIIKKLVKTQDAIILHNDKLLYADLFNKKITSIIVPEKKQLNVEELKKSILNMEEIQKNANNKELALITSITSRPSVKNEPFWDIIGSNWKIFNFFFIFRLAVA